MNVVSATQTPRSTPDWVRLLRYLWRVPALLGHLLIGLPMTTAIIASPLRNVVLRSGERLDHRAVRWWSRMLMRVFAIRVVRSGVPLAGGVLLVSNHRSWMDIELIHSCRHACFVAKAEIARWPLVGWMAARGGTIFHQRGNTESLAGVSGTMVARLRDGLAVAVFPEGGIRPGNRVHTFHARIFQAAIDAEVPAQPVALRATRDGIPTDALSERAREGFLHCFLRLLGDPPTTVEVIFLTPVLADGSGRRRMADSCRGQIVAALGQIEQPRRGARSEVEVPVDDADPLADDSAGD